MADPTLDDTTSLAPSTKTAVILLIVHAALCVFWAFLAGKPSNDWIDLGFGVIMSINYAVINPLITLATGVAFGFQATATGETQNPNALSRRTLVLQISIFLALAVLWPFRFRVSMYVRDPSLWLLVDWYPLVGWACVNNALISIGSCVVLYVGSDRTTSGAQSMSEETEPLLATGRMAGDE